MLARKTHSEKESHLPSLKWPPKTYSQPHRQMVLHFYTVCIPKETSRFLLVWKQWSNTILLWQSLVQETESHQKWDSWCELEQNTLHEWMKLSRNKNVSLSLWEYVTSDQLRHLPQILFMSFFLVTFSSVSVIFSPHIEELFPIMFEINIIILFSCLLSYPPSFYIIFLALFQIMSFVFISS